MALEFILKLQDYMTPKLGAAAKAADSAVAKMNQRVNATNKSISKNIADVGTAAEKAMLKAEKYTSNVIDKNRALAGSYRGLLDEIEKVNRKIASTNNAGEAGMLRNRLKSLQLLSDRHFGNTSAKTPIVAKYAAGSVNDIRAKIDSIRQAANSTNDGKLFKTLTREANALEKQLGKVQAKAEGKRGGLTGMLGGALKPLLAAASIGAIMSFGSSSVKAAMDFGATSKSYEVLAGDATKGRSLANNLNKLQQDTILGPEVFKAGQTLMSFGMSVDKVMPVMKQLGDVSMGNSQRFEALTLAFAQTQSAGKLMGQDLLQYVNAGFNPLQTMSEKWKEFGFKSQMSVGQLRKAMEKGEITSQMVAKSFEIATSKGGKFADMMDTIATTSYGKMKILEGQWENMKINVGNALMPIAEGLMGMASKTLDWLNISKSVPDQLRSEKGEINSLVNTITALNEKSHLRNTYINQLFNKYPDLFSNLNKETASNQDLLKVLNDVNLAYEKKIGLAAANLTFDEDKKRLASSADKAAIYKAMADSYEAGNNATGDAMLDKVSTGIRVNLATRLSNSQRVAYLRRLQSAEETNAGAAQEDVDNHGKAVSYLDKKGKIESIISFANSHKNSKKLKGFYEEYGQIKSAYDEQLGYDKMLLGQSSKFSNLNIDKAYSFLNEGKKDPAETVATDAAKASAEKAMSGQKTITINIQRVGGMDNMHMHTSSVNEGFGDVEKKEKEMFLRVVNAAIGLADN